MNDFVWLTSLPRRATIERTCYLLSTYEQLSLSQRLSNPTMRNRPLLSTLPTAPRRVCFPAARRPSGKTPFPQNGEGTFRASVRPMPVLILLKAGERTHEVQIRTCTHNDKYGWKHEQHHRKKQLGA